MKLEILKEAIYEDKWLFIKRKNGFFYKCQIVEIKDDNVTIRDKYNCISCFPICNISEVSEWRR